MRQGRLFYLILAGFVSGVFARSFFVIPVSVLVVCGVIAVTLVFYFYRQRFADQVGYYWWLGGIALLLFIFGVVRFELAERSLTDTVLASQVGETVTIEGRVIREPDRRERVTLLTVATADTRVLVSTDVASPVEYGDSIRVTGKLQRPEAFVTEYNRTFDYPGYLRARGITHTISFATPTVVDSSPYHPLSLLYDAKQFWVERLSTVLPEPQVGLGLGLLLGVQSALGDELEADFRTAGITHIIVLSGYNIMLVVAFVMYVLAFLFPYRTRLVVGIGAVVVFALLVGYSPSVMRASTMAVLFLLASLTARTYLIVRALCLAGALMILINPHIVRFDVGFQLSFMATLGLIAVTPHLNTWIERQTSWWRWREYLAATVATQIAVAPILLYAIGAWSLVAIPVNLLVLPMVPVAMLLTFITGMIALVVPPLATLVGYAAYGALSYIILVATFAAHVPFAEVVIPPFPGFLVLVLYLLLGLLWYWYTFRQSQTINGTVVLDRTYATWTIVSESSLRK